MVSGQPLRLFLLLCWFLFFWNQVQVIWCPMAFYFLGSLEDRCIHLRQVICCSVVIIGLISLKNAFIQIIHRFLMGVDSSVAEVLAKSWRFLRSPPGHWLWKVIHPVQLDRFLLQARPLGSFFFFLNEIKVLDLFRCGLLPHMVREAKHSGRLVSQTRNW